MRLDDQERLASDKIWDCLIESHDEFDKGALGVSGEAVGPSCARYDDYSDSVSTSSLTSSRLALA